MRMRGLGNLPGVPTLISRAAVISSFAWLVIALRSVTAGWSGRGVLSEQSSREHP